MARRPPSCAVQVTPHRAQIAANHMCARRPAKYCPNRPRSRHTLSASNPLHHPPAVAPERRFRPPRPCSPPHSRLEAGCLLVAPKAISRFPARPAQEMRAVCILLMLMILQVDFTQECPRCVPVAWHLRGGAGMGRKAARARSRCALCCAAHLHCIPGEPHGAQPCSIAHGMLVGKRRNVRIRHERSLPRKVPEWEKERRRDQVGWRLPLCGELVIPLAGFGVGDVGVCPCAAKARRQAQYTSSPGILFHRARSEGRKQFRLLFAVVSNTLVLLQTTRCSSLRGSGPANTLVL